MSLDKVIKKDLRVSKTTTTSVDTEKRQFTWVSHMLQREDDVRITGYYYKKFKAKRVEERLNSAASFLMSSLSCFFTLEKMKGENGTNKKKILKLCNN